jgi:RecB family exonuclease
MAETFDDDFETEMLDFKDQMLRFAKVAEQKFDGLSSDVRENSFRIDKVEQNLSSRIDRVEVQLGQKIDVLDRKVGMISSKLDQVTEKVVDHEKRIRNLEGNATTNPPIN